MSRTPVWGQGPSVVGDPAGCSTAEDPAHEIGRRCLWTNQNNLTLEMNGNTGNDWLIFLNFSGFNHELCTFRTPDSNKAKYGTMRKNMNNHSIRNWIERSWRSLSDIYLQLITSIWYHLIYTAMHLAIWQQPSSSCTLEHLSSHIKRMGPIPNSAMTPLDTLTPHRRRSSQHVCCWEGGHVQLASLPSTLSLLTTISSIPRSTSWCSFERAYENARCNVWVKTYYTCISGVLHIHK